MKTDYPELENKIIDYHHSDGRFWMKGKVIGCNYHIGITIVDENTGEIYLVCIKGPSSPNYKENNPRCLYRKAFQRIVKGIQKGKVPAIRVGVFSAEGRNPTAEDCPYNQ
jgi:hypothetical protein